MILWALNIQPPNLSEMEEKGLPNYILADALDTIRSFDEAVNFCASYK